MKRFFTYVFILGVFCLCAPYSASAQINLKNLLNSSSVKEAVSAVTSGKPVTTESLNGTWKYVKPACEFKSEDLLKKAGGAIAANEIEEKLAETYTKAGIQEMKYTFNAADSTFTTLMKTNSTKGIGGTFTLNAEDKTITFTYQAIKLITLSSVDAKISMSGDNLVLLFNADKILNLMKIIALNSKNTTLKALGQLADQYDGMLLGFELSKENANGN